MKILVTGATGVVGTRLVPLLVAAGHEVTPTGRNVDLFDRDAVARAVAGHEVVINLATHMPSSTFRMLLPGAWRENDRIRRVASGILVDAAIAAGARRFIQESFAPLYADGGDAWLDETAPIAPARYNRTAACAEQSAERFTGSGGVGIVLRFAGFYGPDAFHFESFIEVVRKGWSPLPGSPEAFVSSVAHDDAASAVAAALAVPAGIYNVADDEPLRRRDYVNELARLVGVSPPRSLPAWLTRLGGSMMELLSRSQRISNRKLKAASGWAPKFPSVREGWPATVAAMRPASRG